MSENITVSEKLGKKRIHFAAFFPFHPKKVTEETIKDLAEAGIDISMVIYSALSPENKKNVLDWHAKHGVMAWIRDPYLREGTPGKDYDPTKKELIEPYKNHPAFFGNVFNDEPGTAHYKGISDYVNAYHESFPGKIPFVNLLPFYASDEQLTYGAAAQKIDFYDTPASGYEDYLERFTKTVDVPFICTDIYPLRCDENKKKTAYKNYVRAIEFVAREARSSGREFWCYIQSFSSKTRPLFRVPDEKDLRWQCYSMLSFGAKTILYFVWHGPEVNDYLNTPIDAEGNKNPLWYSAKKVNSEIIALSDVYLEYDNIGAFNVNAAEDLTYLHMTYPLDGFEAIEEIKCDDPLLVGCFNKKDGTSKAVTVVNMSHREEDKTITASVKFSSSRITAYFGGVPQILTPDTNGRCNITLESGEGVFITVE